MIVGNHYTRTVTIDGKQLDPGPSQKLYNHSPDGFAWGYGGSGPSQLALALLLEITDEEYALDHYQDFKFDVIATQPTDADFYLPVFQVVRWAENHGWIEKLKGKGKA